MHPAVELLLKRMESNPEEFVNPHQRNRRWEIIMEKYKGYMKEEEKEAVKEKYSQLQMDACHKEIMAELLREPQQELGKQIPLPFDATGINLQGTMSTTNIIKQEIKRFISDNKLTESLTK